jgi:exodeoxyribonuclease V gamma subunit
MLHVHFSNRAERLLAHLLARLAAAGGDPFVADQVIVPSIAIRRAVTLAIARTQGVCANVRFSYLAPRLWQQLGRWLPGDAAIVAIEPAVLAWRIDAIFGDREFVAAHPRLAAYLAAADEVMRHALAAQVAELFDHYHSYRPEWVAAWQAGRAADTGASTAAERADARWQAALWQRLAAEGAVPAAIAWAALDAALQRPDPATSATPVHLFMLPAMAPLHLEALQRIVRVAEVHLYVLNPCGEYWFELVDPRRLAWLAARDRAQQHEVGNRLLAAWGKQTQAQVDLLVDRCGDAMTDDAEFVAADGDSLLAQLQRAILELRELAPGTVRLAQGDRSIEVQVCHSRTRELEILHDRLLGLLAAGEVQHPSEILVVTPDLDAAAPLIDAVFGTVPPERRIPYTISGRSRSRADAAARALLALLGVATSRFGASELAALLQHDLIARRFGLGGEAFERIHDWLQAASVRWGLDAAHRAGFGVPPTDDHTWAQGLERLFLGYALPPDGDQPFAGLLPAGDAEGSEAALLGALWRLVEALRGLRDSLALARGASAWQAWLADLVDRFLAPEGDEVDAVTELHASIRDLTEAMRRGGRDDPTAPPVPLPVLRDALQHALDDPARGGVPSGGVTFSAMASLRGLPYSVVAVIGLDDGAFPSAHRASEFDLIALRPRRGDRQRRLDERNLFLDLLLAARRVLHLSHVGRSVRDNAPLPPSVLVAELLDLLVPAIAADPASASSLAQARGRLVVEHPLQPFAIEAFSVDADPRRRSHDREIADALRRSVAAPAALPRAAEPAEDDDDGAVEPLPVFFAAPLPPPDEGWRRVSLDRLVEFFRNPCRTLLSRRIGIELSRADDPLVDDEPLVPDWSGRNALAQRLLPALLAGADAEALRRLAQAGGELPAGAIGREQLELELAAIRRFAAQVGAVTRAPCLPPRHVEIGFDLDGEAWQLQADFADLRPDGLVRWRYDELRAAQLLEAWIAHLLLSAAQPAGVAPSTRWIAIDRTLHFAAPAADARERLAELLRLYRRGLREPIEFFPKSAWSLVDGGSIAAARRTWTPTPDRPFAEGADPAYRLALRGRGDPLGGEFEALATTVFGPALRALAEPE